MMSYYIYVVLSNDITGEDINLTYISVLTYIRVKFAPVPYAYQPWFYARVSDRPRVLYKSLSLT